VDVFGKVLGLSSEEREWLQAVARQVCGEARLHRRAHVVLRAAERESVAAIARRR